ncbi:hypothetical protein FNV43_RR02031 [Rhamnella rubrinervis]|uniref:Uncharacterized protein n=1 Tax=Rhamnella rubrinervis TaxID=2594499 RepID=A0A8K0HS34_9ROSA|nr:hypothetical protein FNV43_RR02031 [Rhamnella rubrinervis]
MYSLRIFVLRKIPKPTATSNSKPQMVVLVVPAKRINLFFLASAKQHFCSLSAHHVQTMASPPGLLGPPELYNPKPKPDTTSGDPFIDLLTANFNKTTVNPIPMGLTKNSSPTYLSSGNPCLDFFFQILPDTTPESLVERLEPAWKHNPLTTLKLVCNLRGVRGTGKNDKEGFYTAAFWLHKQHPKTLACNVSSFAGFGCFKDLPEILYRILQGADVRRKQEEEWLKVKGSSWRKLTGTKPTLAKPTLAREIRVKKAEEKAMREKEKARELRVEKRIAMAKKAVETYANDPDFRFLYDQVSDHFAECLKADIGFLNSKKYSKISLAAKWCPSLDSSYDRSTLLCESIARKVFPRESYPEYQGIEEAHYAYRVRDRLRKQILVPLRKALELPEVYISANLWNAIPYNRVASVAMRLYKDRFLEHDKERFKKYLQDVKAGKAKIAAGALLPHEIIRSLGDKDGGQVAKLQWERMVDDLLKEGKMKNCLAVCDVSGSMEGIPMNVSVALGLLVSELSEDPWKGKIITFSENPQLHLIQGDDLESKAQFVTDMDWGYNTNFQKVFDLILQAAVDGNLKPEHMIKRVFVFSDMEFDQASQNPWETDYMAIKRKFEEKGYGQAVPEIVFWNLINSWTTPVSGNQQGVALVSGFSKNLLKLFLDGSGIINPESVMEVAICGKAYQKLVVVD